MGFLLKKFFSYWLMPLPFGLLLLSLGLFVWYFFKWNKSGKTLSVLGFLWLLTLGNGAVSSFLLSGLEARYKPVPELAADTVLPTELTSCEYIVVLGGGHAEGANRAALSRLSSSALARLTEGVRLAQMLPRAKLVLSGPADSNGKTHATLLEQAAVSLGFSKERIIKIDTAKDTEDEARAVGLLVKHSKLALVTSAYHMHRAKQLFEKKDLQVYPCPTDFKGRQVFLRAPRTWSWDTDALSESTVAVHEHLGLWWNQLRGQL